MPQKMTYSHILNSIKNELTQGGGRVKMAVAKEIIATHWRIGKVLNEQVLPRARSRAENHRIIVRLAGDLKRPDGFFYEAARFYRLYPELPQDPFLGWKHYAYLCMIKDKKQRESLEKKAVTMRLDARELVLLIRSTSGAGGVLPLKRGRLFHYLTTTGKAMDLPEGYAVVDIGFSCCRALDMGKRQIRAGHVVRVNKKGEAYGITFLTKDAGLVYTYKARVQRVVDGDTLVLFIDCGFYNWIKLKVRLRGIDCPEMTSTQGALAGKFVKEALKKAAFVVVKTYKADKYGRYLADIFYDAGEKDPGVVAEKGRFLNQELLDEGLGEIYNK